MKLDQILLANYVGLASCATTTLPSSSSTSARAEQPAQHQEIETASRSYDLFHAAAEKHGYKIYDELQIGTQPSVILIGWKHFIEPDHSTTISERRGLQLIAETYRANDRFMVEGHAVGEIFSSLPYKKWANFADFVTRANPDDLRPIASKLQQQEVVFVGSDQPNLDEVTERVIQMGELYRLWRSCIEEVRKNHPNDALLQKFSAQAEILLPNLSELQRINFEEIYEEYLRQIQCEESDRRELKYLVPTINTFHDASARSQVIYVTRGAGHIFREKIQSKLREANIGFIALVPNEEGYFISECGTK